VVPVYFPVTLNNFPIRGTKIPGYAATGICPQPIDESAPFSGLNGCRDAASTRFPVIFPVHGNLPPAARWGSPGFAATSASSASVRRYRPQEHKGT
jgi:hypothetical protein